MNKYREGKMKRTLNREPKELEVVGREAIATCGERLPSRGLLLGTHALLRGQPRGTTLLQRQSSRYQLGGRDAPQAFAATDVPAMGWNRKVSRRPVSGLQGPLG